MNDLVRLSELLKTRNHIDDSIADLIGRPALAGHIGEYIASSIFDIALEKSATSRAIDGTFRSGSLRGYTVNVKWYGKAEGILDLTPAALPDYYLVLARPKSAPASSRGARRPMVIASVFLFDAQQVVSSLRARGVKLGIATSVARQLWAEAEIYPTQRNNAFILSQRQREALGLFR